ncbi:MAG: hypothetical protein JNL32_03890 [Candidatus Kapabacteria bacterium]|nr:hypothetical protein [Candidatus Kapabacteria bacterium]
MFEIIPIYVVVLFTLTTFATVWYMATATNRRISVLIVCGVWMVMQLIIGASGFYLDTMVQPPRFPALVLPPIILTIILFATQRGRMFLDALSLERLTLVHSCRIPVEIILYLLFIAYAVPEEMTFEGRNLDILAGLTAPVVWYLVFKRGASRRVLLVWNILALCLVLNIVGVAILSLHTPFQQFGFTQPNIAVLHIPFVWLPGVIVPLVLLSHLAAIRQLLRKENS